MSTPSNPPIIDAAKSEEEAAKGIAQSHAAAPLTWADVAPQWVMYVANTHVEFTTDDVWAAGLQKPPEPRALGGVFRQLAAAGKIEKVGVQKTAQVSRHRGFTTTWRKKTP